MSTPGVPPLFDPIVSAAIAGLLTFDSPLVDFLFQRPVWGLYLNGRIAINADSTVSLNYRKEWRISDYPQELGAFESYNKVATPYDARVRMTKGGTLVERQAFLAQIDAAAASLNLYDIVTPEKTYINANIAHLNYDRQAHHGAGLLSVDISFVEIRITSAPAFSKTAAPSGASPVSVGTVQAKTVSPSVARVVAAATSRIAGH